MIDIHCHDYPDAYREAVCDPASGLTHYVRDDGRIVVLQDGAVSLAMPQPLPTVTERLAAMDAAGVRMQALSVSAPNVFRMPRNMRVEVTRAVNDSFIALTRKHSDRFRAFASLPLPNLDDALAELERVWPRPEVAGVVLCTTIDRRTLDDPCFEPLWTALEERRATVFVHPTTPCCTDGLTDYALALALDYLAETTLAVGRIVYSGLALRFPSIRFIFSHLGGSVPFLFHRFDNYYRQFPECRARIDRPPSEIMRSLFFDTVTTHAPGLRCALDTFGPDQLMFGTDYPHVPGGLDIFIRTLRSAGLDVEASEKIEWRNAAQALGLDVTGEKSWSLASRDG